MYDRGRLFDLTGKVAVVTGGSRGLGRAMVLAFAHAGADVVVASRKLPSCEATADEVRRLTGRRALPVACHVGDWTQVEALAAAAYREFGTIDVLVNNAGMSPLYDRVDGVTDSGRSVFALQHRSLETVTNFSRLESPTFRVFQGLGALRVDLRQGRTRLQSGPRGLDGGDDGDDGDGLDCFCAFHWCYLS